MVSNTPDSDQDTPSPRDPHATHRAQILDATERELARLGFSELSVARILGSAGVSRATYAACFASKEEVLVALVERSFRALREAVEQTRAASDGPSALRGRISELGRVLERHRSVLLAALDGWNTMPNVRAAWIAEIGSLTSIAAAEIATRRTERGEPVDDAGPVAVALVWTTERCAWAAALGVDRAFTDASGLADVIAQLWSIPLYGATPA